MYVERSSTTKPNTWLPVVAKWNTEYQRRTESEKLIQKHLCMIEDDTSTGLSKKKKEIETKSITSQRTQPQFLVRRSEALVASNLTAAFQKYTL